jgi:hypothetical protein
MGRKRTAHLRSIVLVRRDRSDSIRERVEMLYDEGNDWRQPHCSVEALDLAYAMMIAGAGTTEAEALINGCNIELPPHNQLYDGIRRVCSEIVRMAERRTRVGRKLMIVVIVMHCYHL